MTDILLSVPSDDPKLPSWVEVPAAQVTGTLPGGGGGASAITADDTPAAPAEGESASYFVTSAVVWPAGLVWSTDPDGDVAPTITGTALVSMFTVGDTTRAILGATFPAVSTPDDTTAPAWTATLTPGTPTETSVVVAASALATDNVGVTGYEVSYNNGSTYAAIVPSGSNFTLAGSAGVTYATTKLRAKDAAGNYSTALSVPSYTMASSTDSTPPTVGTMAASAITATGFTLTVSGASDAVGLHAQPYAFTTDGGTTWSAYQASNVLAVTGKAAGSSYSCNWRVRDAAGNVSTGTAQTVTTATAIFADDFDRPDSAQLGDPWVTVTGNLDLANNQLKPANAALSVAVVDAGVANATVAVDIKYSGAYAGLILRQNSMTWVTSRLTTTGLFAYTDAGTLLGEYSFTPVTSQVYRVEATVVGNNYSIKLDGVERITFTSAYNATRTNFGIVTSGATQLLDNFEIREAS